MKKILLILVLFLCVSFTDIYPKNDESNVFNYEWLQSLKEPINFITFSSKSDILQFRIYRGSDINYKVSIKTPFGDEVFNGILKEVDQVNTSKLIGVYYITAVDSKGNKITKRLFIS